MTDNEPEVSSAKKLKPSTTATDDLNCSDLDEKSSKKNTETRNGNLVLLYPNSSCSPEESVFSIDHILESIFADLDQKSLLSCRLVSLRWLHFSSVSLRKIITLKFKHWYEHVREPGFYACRDHRISELIPLMNNSNSFPCNSLSFVNYPQPDLFRNTDQLDQQFFSAHGSFIKKLEIRGDYYLNDVKRLLLTQAPNLEELKFNWVEFRKITAGGRIYIYKRKESKGDSYKGKKKKSLPNKAAISSKPVFKNLKKFVVSEANYNIPDIFLQQLIECSPNLVEVFLPLEYLHFLVKPVNRLHLIKKLELNIKEEHLESLKAVANSRQDNWTVKEIHFSAYWYESDTEFASQVSEALNKILKGCSKTCLKLRYDQFKNDYRFPTMPGVKDVSFHCYNEIPDHIFMKGANLGDTFPNLRSLRVSAEDNDIDLDIYNVFGKNPVPFPNVRKASYSSRFLTAQNILKGFQKLFPQAVIGTDTDSESDEEEFDWSKVDDSFSSDAS